MKSGDGLSNARFVKKKPMWLENARNVMCNAHPGKLNAPDGKYGKMNLNHGKLNANPGKMSEKSYISVLVSRFIGL